jgi:superfamily II RNA helicase
MNGLITHLQEKELLPALFFVLSRKDCEKYAKKVEGTLITSSEVADVRHIWNFHLRNHRAKLEVLPQYHLLFELVQRGIAFHHSGIIPTLKEIVEILFGKGLIKVLFATETFAVGINMPTKTAVFVGLKKYDEQRQGMRMLNTAEYLQMAGRAGRRGLDTMGTVIYLPDRDPVEPSEMRAMMCGGKAPVESRMEFGYDFILKTIQSGNRNWLDLLNKTYWRRQREAVIQDLRVERDKLLSKKQQIPILDSEMDIFSEKVSIEEEIRNTNNAKRKKAELALRKWKEEHMGHRWTMLEENYKEVKGLERLLQNIEKNLATALDVSSSVEARIRVLEDTGFLKHLDDPTAHTKDSLTTQGILATELNEADPILISQFYLSPHSMNVSPKDLLVTLAACITEGKKGDTETSVKELDVSKDVKDAIYEIGDVWNNMRVSEIKMGAKASDWNLSTFWMEIMNRWMDGEAISVLCEEYGVYEGNLIRSVLKLQNMLDEWRSMASFCQHTEMIKKLEEAHLLLVRDAVIQDSLYLHL